MTNKEFAALANQLLPGLPGFSIKGPLLFSVPLKHLLCGVCFDRSSDKRAFYVEVFVLPLFVPTRYLYFTFGTRLRRPAGGGWNADDPELIVQLKLALEREALLLFSNLEKPSDIERVIAALHETRVCHDYEAVAFALALEGHFHDAAIGLDRLLAMLDRTVAWQVEMAERAEMLKAELLEDPARAQRRLLAWEDETARNLKLEAYR